MQNAIPLLACNTVCFLPDRNHVPQVRLDHWG